MKEILDRLRNTILHLAVSGQLVPQDLSEGTGEDLYHEIQKEKARLFKDAKIKKQKAIQPIKPDEIPYEIPVTWTWAKLGDLLIIERGGSPRPIQDYLTRSTDGVNWIKIGDTKPGEKYILRTKEKIKAGGLKKTRKVYPGDLLLSNSMSFGRPYILKVEGCIHDGWLLLRDDTKKLFIDYLQVLLSAQVSTLQFRDKAAGGVVLNLNSEKVREVIAPIPPLAEQKRIVEKVDWLIGLVDSLEKDAEAAEGLLDRLDKAILHLAVSGQLVPQDSAEGTGEELYQQIQAEKARLIKEGKLKKQKDLPPIRENEIPFEIPETWKWVRIRDVTHDLGQKTPSADFSYIDIAAIDGERGLIVKPQILPAKGAPSRARKIVVEGTVIYSTVRPYLMNTAIVNRSFSPEPIASTAFAVLHPLNGLDARYLLTVIRSAHFTERVMAKAVGSAYPAINDGAFSKMILPLPPLAEQKSIVEKVEQITLLIRKLRRGQAGFSEEVN